MESSRSFFVRLLIHHLFDIIANKLVIALKFVNDAMDLILHFSQVSNAKTFLFDYYSTKYYSMKC